ncbi:response regulator [Motiliproteus sediminis]|uniref:response regulator n=1 Tax=Motiliproteus sediminis TaxID=1468178 RepID=UPI001AEF4AE7|nr:response regulator [Motiliproteus sediminis]
MGQGKHNFSGLRFLIIDDFANFCSALRTMVMSYGVSDIDVVHNGDDALQAINKNRYDVILCDYNLGEGRTGNDVLEESKHRNLLKSSNLFVMITAENTAEMVRGALEYQPDDYLTKPFTKEVLLTRLERLLDRSEAFKEVYRLRDKEQLTEAAALCEQLAAERGRYSGYALKLQAELLMQAKQYPAATALFQQVLMIKNLAWAKLGLGKSYYFQEDLEKAAATFSSLVQEDAGYVQAWDWLARCQQQTGDLAAAQQSLESAVKVSPINIRRQTLLGELALENGDTERAEVALGRAVKIGKHSVFREPDTYIKLSEVLVNKLESAEGLSKKNAELKALGTMDELRQLYKGDAEVNLRSRLVDHQIHTVQGNLSEADKALFKAYDICQHDETGALRADLKESLITRLEDKGREDLVGNLVHAMQQEESSHNRQAVEFYDQGDIERALKVLQLAAREKPRSFAVNLNLAQVAMHHIVKFGMDRKLLEQAGEALQRVAGIKEDDSRSKLYHNLQARYLKLKQRLGEAQ